MPGGGIIRISTKLARVPLGDDRRDYVRVRVGDNGAGMPPEVLNRIFDPFFTTKGDRGTGLGLPQVHSLMQQAGGLIRVHSKVGKGTRFDLFFPVEKSAPVAADNWRQLDQWADEGGSIFPARARSA